MQIPTDMHKWRANFAWKMIAYAVVMLLLAGLMVTESWFTRSRVLTDPEKLFLPTIGVVIAAGALVCVAFMCIGLSINTRKFGKKIKALEEQRAPMTLEKLREELQPEKQEQYRNAMLRVLQSSSPQARAFVEVDMKQAVDKIRAELGSTPEVEAELSKLEASNRDLLAQAMSTTSPR